MKIKSIDNFISYLDETIKNPKMTDKSKWFDEKLETLSEFIKVETGKEGLFKNLPKKDRIKVLRAIGKLDILIARQMARLGSQTNPIYERWDLTISKLHETLKSPSLVSSEDLLLKSMTERTVNPKGKTYLRSQEIASQIDSYVHSLLPKLLDRQKKNKEKTIEKLNKVSYFFVNSEAKPGEESRGVRSISPIERVVQTLNYLPIGKVEKAFEQAIAAFMNKMIQRAFDQHLENPEQYCSHGFDHSLNVADYTKSILEKNPKLVEQACNKYKMSQGEAKAALELVALLHDCGYPMLEGKSKAVHGISGADIVEAMRKEMDQLFTAKDMKRNAFHSDFYHAIMFHSADKVQKHYSAKVETNRGTFLLEQKDILEVVSTFHNPKYHSLGVPRYAQVIYVTNEKEKANIIDKLKEARLFELEHLSKDDAKKLPPIPKVRITKSLFKGRHADLKTKGDKLLGLEFRETDVLDDPLSIIRIADNMDMRLNRLTPLQREDAFREVYIALGDGRGRSQAFMKIEQFVRKFDQILEGIFKNKEVREKIGQAIGIPGNKLDNKNAGHLAKIRSHLSKEALALALKEVKTEPFATISEKEHEMVTSPKEALILYKNKLIEGILAQPKYKKLSKELREEIRSIGVLLSDYDLRHFGGCESVVHIELKSLKEKNISIPVVEVVVDRKKFDELNKYRVTEKTEDEYGKTQTLNVGVGEYQIWRASDAFKSVLFDKKTVKLLIKDTQGKEIKTSF